MAQTVAKAFNLILKADGQPDGMATKSPNARTAEAAAIKPTPFKRFVLARPHPTACQRLDGVGFSPALGRAATAVFISESGFKISDDSRHGFFGFEFIRIHWWLVPSAR